MRVKNAYTGAALGCKMKSLIGVLVTIDVTIDLFESVMGCHAKERAEAEE
jgi:hypothetical protein